MTDTARQVHPHTRPKKALGQHFLVDGRIAGRIVDEASPGPDDTVLEIGPGRGILTEHLAGRAGRVVAVELDRDLIAPLRAKFGGVPGVEIVEGDILATDMDALFGGEAGRIMVVANLPYNISVPVVERLCRRNDLVRLMVVMVQREVAYRMVAPPGSKAYGLVSLNIALAATGRVVLTVRPGSFAPSPAVMSSVVRFEVSPEPRFPLRDEAVFRELTGAVFRHRRKMLRNTLTAWLASRGLSEQGARSLMEASGIDPSDRPERIAVEHFADLANRVADILGVRP